VCGHRGKKYSYEIPSWRSEFLRIMKGTTMNPATEPRAAFGVRPACRRLRNVSVLRKREQAPAPYTHLQSQRDCVLQPRVASLRATLGLRWHRSSTLKGLRPDPPHSDPVARHNPFRVDDTGTGVPRVARSSQPWASSRNPFVIRTLQDKSKMRVRCRAEQQAPRTLNASRLRRCIPDRAFCT